MVMVYPRFLAVRLSESIASSVKLISKELASLVQKLYQFGILYATQLFLNKRLSFRYFIHAVAQVKV